MLGLGRQGFILVTLAVIHYCLWAGAGLYQPNGGVHQIILSQYKCLICLVVHRDLQDQEEPEETCSCQPPG